MPHLLQGYVENGHSGRHICGRSPVKEIVFRFLVGGLVVSTFAALADLLKPKSFAGLFGAAPAIALATLLMTVMKDGREHAAIEGKAMILGGISFFLYAWVVSRWLIRKRIAVLTAAAAALVLWFGCAF